jgi:pSer/pThr/pTyr-binding forkhead associated (FHA) protein
MGQGLGVGPRQVGPEPHPWGYAPHVSASPLHSHVATPTEIRERIQAERRGTPFLVYRDADDRQVLVDLADREHVTIGRRESSDVPLAWDASVSRLHAHLERVGTDWLLADDGLSRNGTYVNGQRIEGRRTLRDGDVVAIGGTLIAFLLPSGASSSAATATARGPLAALRPTPAQQRVLVALCRPFAASTYAAPASNRQIADELVVSVDTVKGTLHELFETFGLRDLPQNQKRAALALRALELGLVSRRDL